MKTDRALQCEHECVLCTQGKWPVRTGIGRTQPAVDRRRPCTVCVPLQSVCILFQSVLGPLRQWKLSYARAYGPFSLWWCHAKCANIDDAEYD